MYRHREDERGGHHSSAIPDHAMPMSPGTFLGGGFGDSLAS